MVPGVLGICAEPLGVDAGDALQTRRNRFVRKWRGPRHGT